MLAGLNGDTRKGVAGALRCQAARSTNHLGVRNRPQASSPLSLPRWKSTPWGGHNRRCYVQKEKFTKIRSETCSTGSSNYHFTSYPCNNARSTGRPIWKRQYRFLLPALFVTGGKGPLNRGTILLRSLVSHVLSVDGSHNGRVEGLLSYNQVNR